MLVGAPAVTTAVNSNGSGNGIKVDSGMPLSAKSPSGPGLTGHGTPPPGGCPHGSRFPAPPEVSETNDNNCETMTNEDFEAEQVVPSSVHSSVIEEAAQKVDLLRNCRGIRNGLSPPSENPSSLNHPAEQPLLPAASSTVQKNDGSPSTHNCASISTPPQPQNNSQPPPLLPKPLLNKHLRSGFNAALVASSRTNTTSQNRIPFIKANGFCSKDYPAMNEVAAELKWDLRSQIHPTVTQTASEPQTTHQQMGGSLTSSSGLPNPCCSVVTAADLSRASHQRPRKRLSGSSSESFNEMNMLSQVNMSGLRAATDEHRERGRRIGWVFLLTVCFAVMVAQITDRVRHFLSEPVSVQVTVARNYSLIFPAITICNKNKFNMTAMEGIRERSRHHHRIFTGKSDDIASLLALPNMDAHKLWNLTSHSKQSMIKECWFGRNVTCDVRGSWRPTLTTMGVCHTYTLNDSLVHLAGIFHNMYLKLEESEDDHYLNDDGWKFHIHDVNEVPILAVTTHGTSLYPGQGRDLRLDMKKISALHHKRSPCENDRSYLQNNCFIDCFMKRLAQENITCRLPYMNAIHLPHCRTPESYRYTEQVAEKLFFFGQWNPNQCNCRSQCLKMLYTSSLESTTDRFKITKGRTKARVRIYYQNLEFEYIKEDVGYGTIDLLCDVGGTLSLLMGASLLTCCELLEVAWIVMAKKCCRKVGKTLAAPSRRRAKRPFQSQDQRGSTAGLGGLEGAGDSTSAVASNTTKLQTKV